MGLVRPLSLASVPGFMQSEASIGTGSLPAAVFLRWEKGVPMHLQS